LHWHADPDLHSAAVSDAVEANLALARRGYELWNTGGVEAFEQIWAPGIVFRETPEFPDTGIFRGAEAFAAHCRDLVQSAGHFQWNLRSLEGRGDWVLSALDLSIAGASSGAAVTTPFFHVARYSRGRLLEMRSYLDGDQARREYERLSPPAGGFRIDA
jgi:ketosteroid isomerase-like protein